MLETLLGHGIYGPESISIDVVIEWFAESEQNFAEELINDCARNEDHPLSYEIGDHSRVWLRDKEETEERVQELREDPPWYNT